VNRNTESVLGRRPPYGTPVQPQGTLAGSIAASDLATGYQVTSSYKMFQGKKLPVVT
jgi:hypothetical protein